MKQLWGVHQSAIWCLAFSISLALMIPSCATVPITGRRQLDFIPNATMLSMSLQEYDRFLKEHQLSQNVEHTQMVRRVGLRIQQAVERYFAEQNRQQELQSYQWEFNLVESEDVNAWCMPGGKVVVYTGILPIVQGDNGLAVVLGHEIAHAVAKHGAERMSQMLLVEMGGLALSEAMKQKPEQTRQLWLTAFGVGAQLGAILPYSRLHESEADYLGLVFMARAGYDPNYAIEFWQQMSEQSGGKSPPEILSTHPSDKSRIAKIKEAIPEVMPYYTPK